VGGRNEGRKEVFSKHLPIFIKRKNRETNE
jgi:hypothetical protein